LPQWHIGIGLEFDVTPPKQNLSIGGIKRNHHGRFVCSNLPDSPVPAGPLCPVVPQEAAGVKRQPPQCSVRGMHARQFRLLKRLN